MMNTQCNFKLPTPLSPDKAWEMALAEGNAILVDIRATMEYLFVGHPVGAIHIPWMDEPDWVVNPNFVSEVQSEIEQLARCGCRVNSHETGIILVCRSGWRSMEAGRALLAAGLGEVYHVWEGFEGELDENGHRSSMGGWRYCGLPWEQC